MFDLVPDMICLITSDQRRARSSATFALRCSHVIEHDVRRWNSVLLATNLGDGSFFFVQGSSTVSYMEGRELQSRDIDNILVLCTQGSKMSWCVEPHA